MVHLSSNEEGPWFLLGLIHYVAFPPLVPGDPIGTTAPLCRDGHISSCHVTGLVHYVAFPVEAVIS